MAHQEVDSLAGETAAGFGRMHHIAYIVKDLGVTRRFYQDVIGLPLIATWAEAREFPEFPGRVVEYCHAFFGLSDGSALAFFCFADEDVYRTYYRGQTPFVHVALNVSAEFQRELRSKIEAAGIENFSIDHGYCQSLYIRDPDGLNFEVTTDPRDAGAIAAWQAKTARSTLDRWVAGDRTPNNELLSDHAVHTM